MKITVMGAGAVGCYYGGMLARAGHEVALVARQNHVQAIQQHGLKLETRTFTEQVSVQAGTEPWLVQGADVVLFCVKSTDTDAAGTLIQPFLGADTVILSLQNGVDNAQRLSEVLGRSVVPTVVYVATEMGGPGHVRHHGRGDLLLGPWQGSAAFVEALSHAAIPAQVSDNVMGELWGKLIVNCSLNGLSAITRMPYGPLAQVTGMQPVLQGVVRECVAVAQAEGIQLPADPWAAVEKIIQTMPTQRSSTAQDLARRKPTEIDHLNGYMLRRATALGLSAPFNQLIYTLIKALETQAPG